MLLNEIEAGSRIYVQAKGEGSFASMDSVVAVALNNCVLVEPFEHEDKRINFESAGVTLDMLLIRENESPLGWNGVTISKEEYEGKIYHCIYSRAHGTRVNRRNYFRQFVGEPGIVESLKGDQKLEVTVKDISSRGVGILLDKKIPGKIPEGTIFKLHFDDPQLSQSLEVMTRTIRNEELEHHMLYGCVLTQSYINVDRYIAAKQVKNGLNNKKVPIKK